MRVAFYGYQKSDYLLVLYQRKELSALLSLFNARLIINQLFFQFLFHVNVDRGENRLHQHNTRVSQSCVGGGG
jgi:hypothetical protein